MSLEKIRNDIDRIDREIMSLFDERLEKGLLTKRYKKDIKDNKREEEIMAQIDKRCAILPNREYVKNIFSELISFSRDTQKKKLRFVGFVGAHGSYAEKAALSWDKNVFTFPYKNVPALLQALESGDIEYAIFPANFTEGISLKLSLLLSEYNLSIIHCINLQTKHNFMTLQDTNPLDIKNVLSHSLVLEQCKTFITNNKFEATEYYDTAAAARLLTRNNLKAYGVICGEWNSELYGLKIIDTDINDKLQTNIKYYFVTKNNLITTGDKCSAIFKTRDKSGSLFKVLETFAQNEINLSRIESIQDGEGFSTILLDIEGSLDDPNVDKVIKDISSKVTNWQTLGCYKEANAN